MNLFSCTVTAVVMGIALALGGGSVAATTNGGDTISGVVVGADGQPVTGAEIRAFRERVRPGGSLQERLKTLLDIQELRAENGVAATTDTAGRYRLRGLIGERYRIRVIGPGHAPLVRRQVAAGSEGVDFALKKGGRLAGAVLSSRGEPIENAELSVYFDENGGEVDIIETVLQRLYPPIITVRSGAEGRFRIDGVGGSLTYRLVVVAPGHQAGELQRVSVATGSTQSLDVTLEPGRIINGFVVSPTGGPVAGARVQVRATKNDREASRGRLEDLSATTDSTGWFEFDVLEDGEYRIVASHSNYATLEMTGVQVDATELQLKLTTGASIAGVVRDMQSGEPIAGATVTVQEPAGVEKTTITDAEGHYLVHGVSVGRRGAARLGCTKAGYATVRGLRPQVAEGERTESIDIHLAKNGIVQGVIVNSDGEPVADCVVEIKRENDPSMPILITVGGPVRSSADGSFRVEEVSVGAGNFVVVRHREHLESRSGVFDLAPGATSSSLEIVIRSGGSIRGIVVDQTGAAVVGAKVAVKGDRLGEASIDGLPHVAVTSASGVFALTGIEPGGVTLVAEAVGFLRIELPGVIVTEGETTTTRAIRLRTGSFVSGFVRDEAGTPIAGASVKVIDTSDGLRRLQTRTDANGYYRIEELGGYPVRISIEKDGHKKTSRHEVTVNTENNDFVLQPKNR